MNVHPLRIFSFLIFLILYSNNSNATVYYAAADADWDEATTWSPQGVPGALDDVIIDGYTVTIDINTGDVNVKSITLLNTSTLDDSELFINGLITVTVSDDLIATLGNLDDGIEVKLLNGAIFNVNGYVDFTRDVANSYNKKMCLKIVDASKMYVTGTFNFDYKNANTGEGTGEILIDGSALLDITGNTTLYMRGGNDFDFTIQGTAQAILRANLDVDMSGGDNMIITSKANAHFQVLGDVSVTNSGGTTKAMLHAYGSDGKFTIDGNLTMNSTVAAKAVIMEAGASGCIINVLGDISMNAQAAGDVYISLQASSNLFMGGQFLRPTNYGALLMAEGATLTYNGTLPQIIADEDLAGSDADAFNYTNVVLDNAAGFTLENNFTVVDNLDLANGNIKTNPSNMVIIADNATITGGSQSAYIEGPLTKIGRSSSDFVFPVGDENDYAPIGVEKLTNATLELTTQYDGDPPPFGVSLTPGVNNISNNEYWTITKSAAIDLDITLFWEDADRSGVEDLSNLIVVGLNASNEWESFGRESTTGGVGFGVSGSITSLDGDPPPFGTEKFTFGSDSADKSSLPVELIKFNAIKQKDEVYLQWETASEINSGHFIVQRSDDGIFFEDLKSVLSFGNSESTQQYSSEDIKPYYGLNYYRLQIVDLDGSTEYSNIEVVEFELVPVITLYPNPVKDVINLEGEESYNEQSSLEIFDRNGKLIFLDNVSFNDGTLLLRTDEINVQTPGTYFLRIGGTKESKVIKFIKLN